MTSTENVYSKFSMNNPCKPVHGNQSATASDCSESTSSQPPLKRFWLLAQDMMEHSSAAAATLSNSVDTEPTAYFAECRNYPGVGSTCPGPAVSSCIQDGTCVRSQQ